MAKDSLSITDNRTGKSYELPVSEGTIRAMDLRQIKVTDDDFGLMTYDPAFMNTAAAAAPSPSSMATRASCATAATPSSSWPRSARSSRWPTCWRGRAPDQGTARGVDRSDIRFHTYVHTNIIKFLEGFRYDAHPMGMLLGAVGALSTFYPDAKHIDDQANRYLQRIRLIAKLPTHRGVRLPALARPAVRLPAQRPDYIGNFVNMTFEIGGKLRAERGAAAGARDPVHPPCRPRAELLDQRGAGRRLVGSRPVLRGVGGHRRPLWPAARRRQRGGAAHARRDRPTSGRSRLHREGEVGGRRTPDGVRTPGIQVIRPARQADQEGGVRRVRADRAQSRSSRSRSSWSASRSTTSTSSSGSSTRTWTSIPASSTRRWAIPRTISPCSSPSGGCRDGWRSGRRCCSTRNRRSPGRDRSISAPRNGTSSRWWRGKARHLATACRAGWVGPGREPCSGSHGCPGRCQSAISRSRPGPARHAPARDATPHLRAAPAIGCAGLSKQTRRGGP